MKECYYYLDSTPTHSYMKFLYKYPQAEFPYGRLVEENRERGKHDPEFELIDTGVFDENRYFDVFVEYAKADVEDILVRITVANRGPEASRRCNCFPRYGSAIHGHGDDGGRSRGCSAVEGDAAAIELDDPITAALAGVRRNARTAVYGERHQLTRLFDYDERSRM